MKPIGKHFFRYQAPAIVWALFIFGISSLPDVPGPRLNIRFEDKLDHIVAYALGGILLCRAFLYQSKFPRWQQTYFVVAFVVGILYGISDEFHQMFVPGRYADVWDVVADSVGILLGVLLYKYRFVLPWIRTRKKER